MSEVITFEPVSIDAVPKARRTGTRNGKFLAAFIKSGADAAKVTAAKVTAGSLNQTAKSQGLPVKARTIGGTTYVMRTDRGK